MDAADPEVPGTRSATDERGVPVPDPSREGEPVDAWLDDPDNYCVGCSTANPHSLVMRFARRGAGVEGTYRAARELNGAPDIVHGGMQAVMVDEAMGHSIRAAFAGVWPVTVDLRLRYRRPVRTEVPLLVRAEVVARDGRVLHLEASILDDEERVLTEATAEFRLLDLDRT